MSKKNKSSDKNSDKTKPSKSIVDLKKKFFGDESFEDAQNVLKPDDEISVIRKKKKGIGGMDSSELGDKTEIFSNREGKIGSQG